jgi:hypothetical protein
MPWHALPTYADDERLGETHATAAAAAVAAAAAAAAETRSSAELFRRSTRETTTNVPRD